MDKIFEAEVPVTYQSKKIVLIPAKDSKAAKKELLTKYKVETEPKEKNKWDVICGIIALSITVIMSFFRYFPKSGGNYVVLFPNMISILLSLVMYSAFVIRVKRIENVFKNLSDLLISLLFIVVLAIFIKLFAADTVQSNGIIGKFLAKIGFGNSYLLIIAALILSWLGMKQICGVVLIAILLFGSIELATCGDYMRNFKSVLFILSAFCGCVFYLKYEGDLIIQSFTNLGNGMIGFMDDNIKESTNIFRTGTISSHNLSKETNPKIYEENNINDIQEIKSEE